MGGQWRGALSLLQNVYPPLFTSFITPALLLKPFSINSEFLRAEDHLFYLFLLCHR